jgi:hypothetical protein
MLLRPKQRKASLNPVDASLKSSYVSIVPLNDSKDYKREQREAIKEHLPDFPMTWNRRTLQGSVLWSKQCFLVNPSEIDCDCGKSSVMVKWTIILSVMQLNIIFCC